MVGDGRVSSNDEASKLPEDPKMDDGALDATLGVAMMGVQDCRLEGRAFGTKTSIILSAYRAISVLRVNMDVFEPDAPWEDNIRQNLDDGKFVKLFFAFRPVQIETQTGARSAI